MKRKIARFGLKVNHISKGWFETACRFTPDTRQAAFDYGNMLIRDGYISDFEVMDRKDKPDAKASSATLPVRVRAR